MRKKELKIEDYKSRNNYEFIAMVFMPNRFSQKLGRWEVLSRIVDMRKKVYQSSVTVPVNFKGYKNPNTLIKRLKEFNYVLVHETDIDVIEKLKELNIDFRILPSELKRGCISNIRNCEKLQYRSDYGYIRNNFVKVYNLEPTSKIYYGIQYEYSNPTIINIEFKPTDYIPRDVFETRQEAYKYYIHQRKMYAEDYLLKIQTNQDLLDGFIERYKGEFDE